MKKRNLCVLCVFVVNQVLFSLSYGQEINEEQLFSSPDSIVKKDELFDKQKPKEEEKEVSIALSGQATGVFSVTEKREKHAVSEANLTDNAKNSTSSYIVGNMFLDARQKLGTKYFVDLEARYNPSADNKSTFTLKEMFIDFNIKDRVYFRTGKQVLQWGRNYLWNPTDLINIDKNTFLTRIGSREGAYGLKLHIPFGAKYNIYGFLDTSSNKSTDDLGAALKFEFLTGKTEMAFAAWGKGGFYPVYTYDFSTRLLGIDTTGELALSHGDNNRKIWVENGILSSYREQEQWIPKASLGFGKYFDYADIPDRIFLHLELYYNQNGYTENIFSDPAIYTFSNPIQTLDPSGRPVQKTEGTQKEFLLFNNLYELNRFSKYYIALLSRYSRFIITDLTLSINMIRNLNDNSSIVTAGINYQNIHNLNIGCEIYGYLGEKDREYTFPNNTYTAQCTVGILF
ncbi:MAG: hypothetical protein HY097_05020 [Nitrospinae bacterium]|nr:hypothetical protein [Nitrospinota bacterium]